LDDLIVGAYQAELSGKTLIGKSYVVFGKANNSAIDLSVIADANIRFTCSRLTTWGTPGAYNQIIQAIAVNITCTGY
jgi:hypothetical protein